MDLAQDFKELLAEFAQGKVEVVIVGGYAVAFHGKPRATKDIDLVLGGSPESPGSRPRPTGQLRVLTSSSGSGSGSTRIRNPEPESEPGAGESDSAEVCSDPVGRQDGETARTTG